MRLELITDAHLDGTDHPPQGYQVPDVDDIIEVSNFCRIMAVSYGTRCTSQDKVSTKISVELLGMCVDDEATY